MPSGGYECDWQKGFYPLKTPSLQIDFLPRFSYLVPPSVRHQNRLGAALQEGGVQNGPPPWRWRMLLPKIIIIFGA
jgi:hypothetical protein